jgi:glycerol-3-phosphate dehydrogenase
MNKNILQSIPPLKEEFDVAVIGGGINGAAIARDAALRGLKVILLEKHDFAGGASSKSSKLIHGGLRYLENFQFRLIKESLHEQSILLKTASNLVQPLPFIVPVYQNQSRPLWLIKIGLFLYDFFRSKHLPPYQSLSKEAIKAQFPSIRLEGLKGGCLYYDAVMQDNRIVIENILSTLSLGGVALNYTEVVEFLKNSEGKIDGIRCRDVQNHHEKIIYAKCFVNATGAWSNGISAKADPSPAFEVYPTKGVHLVLPQINASHALLLTAPQDGRPFFLIPWNGYSLLGTTDTPYEGKPEAVSVLKEDLDYLLNAFNHYFSEQHFSQTDIIASFVGLRPLVKSTISNPAQMSRDYHLSTAKSGLITLLGGKYTTYRLMAEKTVDAIFKQLQLPKHPCKTQDVPLCSFEMPSLKKETISNELNLAMQQVERIIKQYGEASHQIFDIMRRCPEDKQQIYPEQPHLFAELVHSIKHEKAVYPDDWLARRTSIAYTSGQGHQCLDAVVKTFETR